MARNGELSFRNPTRIGEKLINMLLELPEGELTKSDGVINFSCRNGVTHIHSMVLDYQAPFYQQITTDPDTKFRVLEVPLSTEIVEKVRRFIYLNELVRFERHEIVEFYAAAKLLCIKDLQDQLTNLFQGDILGFIDSPGFLINDRIGFVKDFGDLLQKIRFASQQDKMTLVQRLRQWSSVRSMDERKEIAEALVEQLYDM